MEQRNVTYLIGAGASAQALPLVKGIPGDLKTFLSTIELNGPEDSYGEKIPYADERIEKLKNDFVKDVQWLHDKTIVHSSIDTYAKKLLATRNHSDLEKLKMIFTLFFLFIQYINLADKRYDAFIAALINHRTEKLPDHVKVLSWNYDIQFEKAMSEFLQSKNFVTAQGRLSVEPRSAGRTHFVSDFSLFKLNGSSVFFNGQDKYYSLNEDLNIYSESDTLMKILSFYEKFKQKKLISAITFAWEEETIARYVLEEAIQKTQNSDVLVVIGYSFPFFNREIDRKLLKMSQLKKIYFQAPDFAINNVVQSFKSIRDISTVTIELITETEQFFLPAEL